MEGMSQLCQRPLSATENVWKI